MTLDEALTENRRLKHENEELRNQIKAYLLENISYRAGEEIMTEYKPIPQISENMKLWYKLRGIFK